MSWAMRLLWALVLFAQPAAAQEDFDRGNFWIDQCTGGEMGTGNLRCTTAITYMLKTHDMMVVLHDVPRFYCPPTGSTVGQVVRVVGTYLVRNPQKLHEPFELLVFLALREAFPCAKTPPAQAKRP